ncbi:MAG: hypothetical protein D6728_17445 [Cyanobacteria bacterium J055]|nr:MAG: hypothetical protein D6728_17445 [Cyanobacteria bacterium J055]
MSSDFSRVADWDFRSIEVVPLDYNFDLLGSGTLAKSDWSSKLIYARTTYIDESTTTGYKSKFSRFVAGENIKVLCQLVPIVFERAIFACKPTRDRPLLAYERGNAFPQLYPKDYLQLS